jgi:hypothetical protein
MHTASKLNATPRERLIEIEAGAPFLHFVTRPLFLAALGISIFLAAGVAIALLAGSAAHDVYQHYT